TATAIGMYTQFQRQTSYCFNRKEKKAHGDQGMFVGAAMQGNIVMVDDVITAGTTVRETFNMIQGLPVKLNGIIIAFDRQEKGQGKLSAIQEIYQQFQVPIQSIITLQDVLQFMRTHDQLKVHIPAVEAYQREFGVI
ncbi:MAG: orotate phosphoribosyltransferase, partial [Proteobacteria bacterium]|nr:orotate phosphoribosyltransferase [Pseudomonadota bacterium]